MHARAPDDFEIEGIPYSHYIRKHYIDMYAEQVLVIEYFDKEVFSNDEINNSVGIIGGFPAYFRISVYIETMEIVDCYTSRL